MAQSDLYNRIFEYPDAGDAALALMEPADVEQEAGGSEAGAWSLLLGAMRLRRAGERSAANDWLNHASHAAADNDVFKAELLGEVGQALYESDRLQDAFGVLNSAIALWRDACEQAQAASGAKEAAAFAALLAPLFAAAKQSTGTGGKPAIVKRWLSERGVLGRAKAVNCFLRLLAKAGRVADARPLLHEELSWMESHFTAADGAPTSPAASQALYLLRLAEGELEQADGDFEKSGNAFGAAAAVYEGRVDDVNDVSRLLRAKFNQANSLLRLNRTKEAIALYELCQHGFNSIGDDQAAQRVEHAIVFAQSMAGDDGKS